VHEKLTAFLELEAGVRVFNQRLFLLMRKSAALIGDPLINPNKFIFADAAFEVANPDQMMR